MMTLAEIACWGSALLLVHVFVGYPLCVWLQARIWPLPLTKRSITPTVTIVIAAYNAEALMHAKLMNLQLLDYPNDNIEIVIVCDGSRDTTAEVCRQFGDPRVRVLQFAERRGKAACLNDAIATATSEVLLLTDVRQMISPTALRELVANLADSRIGAVSGDLQLKDLHSDFAKGIDAYWRYEKLIRNAEGSSGSTIGVVGPLYVMRRELFEPLPRGTVLDDVLIPMRVAARGWRVVFEPRALAWDSASQDATDEKRRKVRTLAGNYQLIQLAPWLLLPWRNPLWFRFISHRLLRLLAPWLIVLFSLAAFVLAMLNPAYWLLVLGLIISAILILVERLLPPARRWLPIRLLAAFFYLNLFSAQALIAFARNRELHLWSIK